MDLENYLENIKNIHGNIANDVWPDGADLICKICDFHIHITSQECSEYLAHGWPGIVEKACL